MQCTTTKFFFSILQGISAPSLYFAWPKLKHFGHSWLTLLLLQQKFPPEPPVSKRWRTFSIYRYFSSRRQQREKMHASRSSKSTTYSYSRCVRCVYVWACECMCMYGMRRKPFRCCSALPLQMTDVRSQYMSHVVNWFFMLNLQKVAAANRYMDMTWFHPASSTAKSRKQSRMKP